MKKRIFTAMNEPAPQVLIGILLMLSLFISDSWILGNAPDSSNDILYGILLAIFIVFSIEQTFLCFVQDGYFLSFFFWMDLIGTLSILLDIGWITDAFIPSGAQDGSTNVRILISGFLIYSI